MTTVQTQFSLNHGPSGRPIPTGFEDLVWLLTCDNRNRGILRMNFDEAAIIWRSVQATTGTILEIGRRHGGSTCLLLTASGSRKVMSVDIAPEHAPASDAFFARPENRSRLELIVGDSRLAIPGQSYGFIFFDGDHSYAGLRGDVLAHWNFLTSLDGFPALAAFHDAVPNPGLDYEGKENFCEGVQRVCEALVSSRCAEIVGSAGSVLVLRKLAGVDPSVFSATDCVVAPETPRPLSPWARQVAELFNSPSVLQAEWGSATRLQLTDHRLTVQNCCDLDTSTAEAGFCLPFSDGTFDTVFNTGSLGKLEDASLPRWLAEICRICERNVWIVLETAPGRDRAWWEQRFLEAGFRKHPLGTREISSETSAKPREQVTLLFEKIPAKALERYPLEKLQAERDLHMDMLRESGIRSEAHVARYTLAGTHLKPGMVVLDVACGLGYGTAILAAGTGVARVIGVDLSEEAVAYARDNYATLMPQVEFHSGDATQLHFLADATVDAVVSFETLEHLPNPDRLLQEVSRVLKPGGLFIGSVPNLWIDEQGRNPVPYHFHIYDYPQFHEQVARYFESHSLYRQNAGGGWKRPQDCQLRLIEGQQPTAADLQDAEWWITVATKLGAGPGPARIHHVGLANRDPLAKESADPSAHPTVMALNPATRIVVLDEEPRYKELFGRVFELLGVRPEAGGDLTPEQILASKPAAILLSREWSYSWRLIAAAARRANVPVIYVMDGVIEWSYVWNNLSFVKPEGTVLQPLLASHLCAVGHHPARILAGLGLADRIHIIGLPRLDDIPRTRTLTSGVKPRILIATAKTFAHNVEQKTLVRRALRDLKDWFAANPFVLPVWRIADAVAEEIGVQPERNSTFEEALAGVSGTISFLSTCVLESMFKGIPTALLDYRTMPLYVQTAWEIRCAEHIPGVIQELLYPPPEKLAFQEHCLQDELEAGNASARLAQVICQAIAEVRSPNLQPLPVLASAFGRLDFHQVHSQLSGFSASLQTPLQYELDALQNLYDRVRQELGTARQELQKAVAAQAETERLEQLCHERGEIIQKLDQVCQERQAIIENLDRLARERQATIEQLDKQMRELALPGANSSPAPTATNNPPPVDRESELKALKATLKAQPNDAGSWVKLGVIFREMTQLAECEIALQEALRLDPQNEQAHLETGRTRLQQKRVWEAAASFERVEKINPSQVQTILLMAQYEEDHGDSMAARLEYLRVLKRDPANALAKDRLAAFDAKAAAGEPCGKAAVQRQIYTCRAPAPSQPTREMLQREYPCDYPFAQLYLVPRQRLDLRFCSYHPPVLYEDQQAVYAEGIDALDNILNHDPTLGERRAKFLAGDCAGAGCSENCIWYNKWKTTGKGFRLANYLTPEGRFKLGKIWLSMGPDCNVTCRYCLDVGEFQTDFNTCDPKVMDLARDFVRRGGELLLTGGETFLPKWGFARILEDLVNWGDAKGTISLHTNGTYLNERNRDLLLRGPLTAVGISMDTLRKDLFEYLRRGTKFDQVWNNVTSLVRERNARGNKAPCVNLLCAVMKSTADHLVETVDRAVAAGVGISLNALFQSCYSPVFSEQEGLHHLSPTGLEKLYQDVLHLERKYGPQSLVSYQGFKGQVENQLQLSRSGQGERQVILGGGGHAPRLPQFDQVARAEELLGEARFQEAADELEPVLPRLKRSTRALRAWAAILAGLHRVDESAQAYQVVLKLDPLDPAALQALEALGHSPASEPVGPADADVESEPQGASLINNCRAETKWVVEPLHLLANDFQESTSLYQQLCADPAWMTSADKKAWIRETQDSMADLGNQCSRLQRQTEESSNSARNQAQLKPFGWMPPGLQDDLTVMHFRLNRLWPAQQNLWVSSSGSGSRPNV